MPCIETVAIVIYPVLPISSVLVGDGLSEGRPRDSQQQDGDVFVCHFWLAFKTDCRPLPITFDGRDSGYRATSTIRVVQLWMRKRDDCR